MTQTIQRSEKQNIVTTATQIQRQLCRQNESPSHSSNFWKITAQNAFNSVSDYKVTPFSDDRYGNKLSYIRVNMVDQFSAKCAS